jgi:hypothetical protein
MENTSKLGSNGMEINKMLPPQAPPRKNVKRVLEEEEYVEALSRIIERDYFPRIVESRKRLNESTHSLHGNPAEEIDSFSVDSFFKEYTSYDNESYIELQNKSSAEH